MKLEKFKMTTKINKSVLALLDYERIPVVKILSDKDFVNKYPQLKGIKFGRDTVGFVYIKGADVVAILLAKTKRYNMRSIHKIRVFEGYKDKDLELGLIHTAVINLDCAYAIQKTKDSKTIEAFEEYGFTIIENHGDKVLLSATKLIW